MDNSAERIADEIWEAREEDIADDRDVKWYVAEADLPERTSDAVYALLVARVAAR